MRLTGALSNLYTAGLEVVLARKRQIAFGNDERGVLRPQLRLPLGAIQTAVLDVLREADALLPPATIGLRVEKRLQRSVSKDTISSFLSVACRAANSPGRRVRRGLYQIAD